MPAEGLSILVESRHQLLLYARLPQAQNVRRVFNALDDVDFSCPVYPAIRERFQLGPRLAWLYTCLLFLLRHRFNLADSRRRLAVVPCETLIDLASAMVVHWTGGAGAAFPPDVAGRALLMLQPHAAPLSRQATGESDPLRVGDAASLPPPIALPPAIGSASVSSGGKALAAPAPAAAAATARSISQPVATHAHSITTARAPLVAPPTVLAVANARGSLRQLSLGSRATVGGEQGFEPPPGHSTLHAPAAPSGTAPNPPRVTAPASASHAALDVSAGAHRSADEAPYHSAQHTPVPLVHGPAHVKGSAAQWHVFHTATLDGSQAMGSPATPLPAAPTPPLQPALPLAGVDTPAPTSSGLGLDLAFLLSLKDFASRLMRTRQERTALCEAVTAAFFQTPLLPTTHTPVHSSHVPAVSSASSAAAGGATSIAHSHTVARSAMLSDSQRKRLEARLPSLLKGLRDMAINLCSVSVICLREWIAPASLPHCSLLQPTEFRDFFEDVALGVVDECLQAGLVRDDMRRLLACIVDASCGLPHVVALPLTARGAYASQWQRFMAVVDYCAARLWSAPGVASHVHSLT